MTDRASDIGDLERMYVNGEASDDCARKAMLIAVRIRTERAFAGSRTDVTRLKELVREVERFHAILTKIRGRDVHHDVLHLYEQFLAVQGIAL